MKKQTMLLVVIGLMMLIIFNWKKIKAFANPGATSDGKKTDPTTPIAAAATPNTGNTFKPSGAVSTMVNPSELLTSGSKGASVTQLQQLIIDAWGASYLPKYGADGDFGKETTAAVKAITGGTSTTLSTFRFNYYNPKKSGASTAPTAPPESHWYDSLFSF